MKIAGWRAWYTGDRIYTNGPDLLKSFVDLPDDGLLCLCVYHDEFAGDVRYRTFVSCPPEQAQDPYSHDYCFGAESVQDLVFMFSKGPIKDIMSRYDIPRKNIKKGYGVDIMEFRRVNGLMTEAVDCPTCS
jgi:hypothetical protein